MNIDSNPSITKITFPISFKDTSYSVLFTESSNSTTFGDYTNYWVYKEKNTNYVNICSSKSWMEYPIVTIIGIA